MSTPASAHDDPTAHHRDTQRLEAFSDGVFAIAITLLTLPLAFISPWISLAMYAGLAVFWLLPLSE